MSSKRGEFFSYAIKISQPKVMLEGIPLARSKLFAEEARSLQVSTI
jgi:hypothetical protein